MVACWIGGSNDRRCLELRRVVNLYLETVTLSPREPLNGLCLGLGHPRDTGRAGRAGAREG